MKPMRTLGRVVLAILPSLGPLTVAAQRSVELSTSRTPPEYTIALHQRLTLSDSASPTKGWSSHVNRDSRDRYYVAVNQDRRVLVFGSDGKYLKSIGRAGKGPGEFNGNLQLIVGRGDTLFVLDDGNERLTVFSPAYEIVRATSFPPVGLATRLRNGWYAQTVDAIPASFLNHRLRLIDPAGRIVKEHDVGPKSGTVARSHVIAEGPSSTLWLIRMRQLIVDQWDTTGHLLTTVHRLPDGPFFSEFPSDSAAVATNFDIQVDSLGRIWTVVSTNNGKSRTIRSGGHTYEIPDFGMLLEVWDPAKGHVVASQRLKGYTWQMLEPGVLTAQQERSDGAAMTVIFDVILGKKLR